jgi:hypothetical protein
MRKEEVFDILRKLQEKYAENSYVSTVVLLARTATMFAYEFAEECRIGDVLREMAALGSLREFRGVPSEVVKDLMNVQSILEADLPEILQTKCSCKVRRYFW